MEYPFVTVFILMYLIFLLIALAAGVAVYVLQGIGLSSLGKKAGLENPWLAWIPVGNLYVIGAIAEKSNHFYGKKNGKYALLLPLLTGIYVFSIPIFFFIFAIAGSVVMRMSGDSTAILLFFLFYLVMLALAIAMSVLYYIALYKLYKLFAPDQAVLFLLLGIFVSISTPIIIFILRNRNMPVPVAPFYPQGTGFGAPPTGGMYPPPQGGFPPCPNPNYGAPMQGGFVPQPPANPNQAQGGYAPQPPVNPNQSQGGGNYPPPAPPTTPDPF